MLSCGKEEQPAVPSPNGFVREFSIAGRAVKNNGTLRDVDTKDVVINISFSSEIDKSRIDLSRFSITKMSDVFELVANPDPMTVSLRIKEELTTFDTYTLTVLKGENCGLKLIDSYSFKFVTKMDESDKFDRVSEDALLTLVQQKTFGYFWEHGHPVSGLARERLNSGNTVTTGGSGFGVMTLPVAIERGFITREEGAVRMQTIATFLAEKAETFHGAFPHWLDGETGKTIAFSTKDNGADIVETALLVQGLLAVNEYFNLDNDIEKDIRSKIKTIWEKVEWDWFLNGTNTMMWHWSPNYAWEMDLPVRGWNEALIVYVLAASSPTHWKILLRN